MCVLRSQVYPERKSQQPFLYDAPKGDFKVGFTCAVVSIVDFSPQTPTAGSGCMTLAVMQIKTGSIHIRHPEGVQEHKST